ncbi:MAG TPA: M20/M25/M40 family metallo-hydrolase [Gammaproteobacteria bacterium]
MKRPVAPNAWFLVSALLLAGQASAQLDDTERAMIEWIDANAAESIELLEEIVNIGSGTMNAEGVREVGRVLRAELDDIGLETEWIELPPEMNRAGHLVGKLAGDRGRKMLLIGHLDTVFEADDSFQAYAREGNIATGPGIDDMKSGDVVIVYALKALQAAGVLDGMQLIAFYTGDEEFAGRPLSISRRDLIESGKWADVALGFEGGQHFDDTDWATVARRGASGWRLEVSGRQAHSSQVFSAEVGAGAIFEAARILNAFYERVRGEEFLTFNAGAILGGTTVDYDYELNRGTAFGKTNVVPNTVVVHGGIRTISPEQLERAQEAMLSVVATSLPHTTAELTFDEGYPAMAPTEGNMALQAMFSDINEALGRGPMPALDPLKRGAADISFVAPYADALAGLGGIGKGGHSPNESFEVDSMPLAVKRAAILMYRLSRQ